MSRPAFVFEGFVFVFVVVFVACEEVFVIFNGAELRRFFSSPLRLFGTRPLSLSGSLELLVSQSPEPWKLN